MKKMGTFKSSFSVILLAAVLSFAVLNVGSVSADHIAIVDLQPEWSIGGVDTDYTMQVCNQVGSHHIDEVRVIKNPAYSTFACEDKIADGWTTIKISPWYDSDLGMTEMCWYYTLDPSNNIPDGACETFGFSATVPEEGCELEWKIETRDEHATGSGNYNTWSDTTSVDSIPPELSKEIIGPQSGI